VLGSSERAIPRVTVDIEIYQENQLQPTRQAHGRATHFIRLITLMRAALAVVLLAFLTGPGLADQPAAAGRETEGTSRPPNSQQLSDLAHQTLHLVNEHRKENQRVSMAWSERIAGLAAKHTKALAANDVPYGHEGFDDRRLVIWQKLELNHAAENMGWNVEPASDTVAVAVQKWIESEEHHEKMLGPYNHAGVGVVRTESGKFYFTLLMAGPWPFPGDHTQGAKGK
jgi:uncharacterized protein YkwD